MLARPGSRGSNTLGAHYKSIVVQDGDYLGMVGDHVHLNPVHGRLASTAEGLEGYAWSSLPSWMP